jgi:uncharacterized protein (TIGR02598 family)
MKPRTSSSAFSLVEVTVAIGIAAFSLIAIFGLLPVALTSNQAAIEQTAANEILSKVITDLRATSPTSPAGGAAQSRQYGISIPAGGAGAGVVQTKYFDSDRNLVTSMADARYRMTIKFLAAPTGGGARAASCASVNVTWPAPVDPNAAGVRPAGASSSFVALNRN